MDGKFMCMLFAHAPGLYTNTCMKVFKYNVYTRFQVSVYRTIGSLVINCYRSHSKILPEHAHLVDIRSD